MSFSTSSRELILRATRTIALAFALANAVENDCQDQPPYSVRSFLGRSNDIPCAPNRGWLQSRSQPFHFAKGLQK